MNNNQTYLKKYLKYKEKYLNLLKMKNILKGGSLTYISDKSFGYTGTTPEKIIQLTNGNIVVCYGLGCYCKIFDISGEQILTFGDQDNFMYPLNMIQLLDGNIAICDNYNNNIQIFDMSGNKVSVINNNLDKPTCIIQLNNTNIIVTDNKTIKIFDISGKFINNVLYPFIFKSIFDIPKWHIINLFNGNFAVYEDVNNQIQIFDINCAHINSIYMDMDIIFISMISLNNNNLAILLHTGILIYNLAGEKKYIVEGYFRQPENIIQLQNNNIIMYDSGYSCLFEFNINGTFIKRSPQTSYACQSTGMIELTNNKIALCDVTNNRIQQFSLGKVTIDMVITAINFNYEISTPNKLITIGYFNNGEEKLFNYKIRNNEINIYDMLFLNQQTILEENKSLRFILINIVTLQIVKLTLQNTDGITRNVFYELSKYLSLMENPYFEKDIDTNLYKLKIITDKDILEKLYFLGQLFGLALKLQIIIPINLDPVLLYKLSNDLKPSDFTEELINTISDSYGSTIVLNRDNYDTNKCFCDGFRTQIDVNKVLIDELPLNLLDKLLSGMTDLNLQLFNQHVQFYNLDEENKDILTKIINDNILIVGENEYLEKLLLVMTGTNRIPGNGYPEGNKLTFEEDGSDECEPYDFLPSYNILYIRHDLFENHKTGHNDQLLKLFNYDYLKTIK